MIENGLEINPDLALDNDGFAAFAFDSHVEVYLKGGLMEKLPTMDLLKIGTAPPLKDLFSSDGLRQVKQIFPKIFPNIFRGLTSNPKPYYRF